MNPRIRVGLVGLGTISQRGILPHLALRDARELLELRAVCDVDAERARSTAAATGLARWYSDLNELLCDPDVDAVLLATPIGLHHGQALAAIAAGKHVYVQKTMTLTVAQADEVIAAAAAGGVVLAVSPGQMLSPGYQRIRELIADGRIGRPYWSVTSTSYVGHEHDAQVDPSWYYRPGGGPLYDMGVYSLHALTGILGPARRVSAMSGVGLAERRWGGRKIRVEMDDNTVLLLDFGDSCFGVVGSQFCDFGRTFGWGFLGVYGSTGAVEVTELERGSAHARRFAISRFGELDGDLGEIDVHDASDPHLEVPESHVWLDIRDFVESVRDRRAPRASARHARHVIEIIERGYVAARSGEVQHLETKF